MTAYNNHVLSQGAIAVARESAAKEQRHKDAALLRRLAAERAAVVAFLLREADNYGERGTVPDVLRAAAYCIEHGDHHR